VRYTRECCGFLVEQGVKLIVLACNTASALALDEIKNEFSIPIIGMIDPVIRQLNPSWSSIGLLATRATVSSGIYQSKISHKNVTAVSAPLLVSLVEEGYIDHPMTTLAIDEYTRPLLEAKVQSVILACTHFPLLKKQIEKWLGPEIDVMDPALAAAEEVDSLLSHHDTNERGSTRFFVTDDVEKFQRLGPQFLGSPVGSITSCEMKLSLL